MKPRPCFVALGLLLASFSAPLPVFAADKPPAEVEEKEKKNITTIVLEATPAAVHDAALQALATIGCEVKKDSPTAIEGKRPNKMGLAVGSGGEKVFVDIKDVGDGKTQVTVTTKKTMVGIVGQKLWNLEVAGKIRDALAK